MSKEYLDIDGLKYFYQLLNDKIENMTPDELLEILPLFNGSKFAHSIDIGGHVYDGTEDIIIAIYDGEVTNDEIQSVLLQFSSMQLNNISSNTMTMINSSDTIAMTSDN